MIFRRQGKVARWVPSGQVVHQHCEKEMARIVEKRVDFASGENSIPLHFVKQFLASKNIAVLVHPP
jgi:hypothetical protein